MATKYECDRCSRQADNSHKIARITYPKCSAHTTQVNPESSTVAGKDLCISCIQALNIFMEPLAQEKPRTVDNDPPF